MKTEKVYEEFLESLNRHKVKYCIIGSYAPAFYAKPRYTKDIDILIEASLENAQKLMKALTNFGSKSLSFDESGSHAYGGFGEGEKIRLQTILSPSLFPSHPGRDVKYCLRRPSAKRWI